MSESVGQVISRGSIRDTWEALHMEEFPFVYVRVYSRVLGMIYSNDSLCRGWWTKRTGMPSDENQ
jgi:hypothetical protein